MSQTVATTADLPDRTRRFGLLCKNLQARVCSSALASVAVSSGAPNGATIGDNMADELRAVAEELGGEAVLGRRLNRDVDLQAAIREGFPQKVIEELMEAADLSIKELAASLDLSLRSLQRRRREGRLARYESDRIYRLARIVALAKSSLGDRDAATRWLKRPNRALGGKAPLAVIDTELGARTVENVLGRIAFGGVS